MAVPACLPLCDVRTAHRSEVLLSVRIVKCRIVFRIGRKTTTDEMNEAKIVRLCSWIGPNGRGSRIFRILLRAVQYIVRYFTVDMVTLSR